MKKARLKNPYIAVMKDGGLSYGGNQSWAEGNLLQKYGCGVIAGTDLILYLGLHKEYCNGREIWEDEEENGIWDAEQYFALIKKLNRKYFWVIRSRTSAGRSSLHGTAENPRILTGMRGFFCGGRL